MYSEPFPATVRDGEPQDSFMNIGHRGVCRKHQLREKLLKSPTVLERAISEIGQKISKYDTHLSSFKLISIATINGLKLYALTTILARTAVIK